LIGPRDLTLTPSTPGRARAFCSGREFAFPLVAGGFCALPGDPGFVLPEREDDLLAERDGVDRRDFPPEPVDDPCAGRDFLPDAVCLGEPLGCCEDAEIGPVFMANAPERADSPVEGFLVSATPP
jgi:hypothetical protein